MGGGSITTVFPGGIVQKQRSRPIQKKLIGTQRLGCERQPAQGIIHAFQPIQGIADQLADELRTKSLVEVGQEKVGLTIVSNALGGCFAPAGQVEIGLEQERAKMSRLPHIR
jgi:hypothetical protein